MSGMRAGERMAFELFGFLAVQRFFFLFYSATGHWTPWTLWTASDHP
jgi:hypothetical protein